MNPKSVAIYDVVSKSLKSVDSKFSSEYRYVIRGIAPMGVRNDGFKGINAFREANASLPSGRNPVWRHVSSGDILEELKILLVDDEAEFVKTLSERIRIRGFGAEFALSGEAALAMLTDSVPDVMVLDLKMPGMEGLEVLRQVKKCYPDLPVLLLTGHGSERDKSEALRLGAFDYLQKPVDINTLIERIRHAHQ